MFNRKNPEEINRLVSDHVSELIFVPTELAARNLRREGIEEARIKLVGDVMYDVALHFAQKAETQSRILASLGLTSGGYILGTVHRAENTDNGGNLRAIFAALCEIGKELPVVLPLHPRTRLSLQREGLWDKVKDVVRVLEPVGYLDMAMLEKNARLIVSDSGGVPKEGYFYQVPSVILRTVAVWEELVESGWAKTVDPGDAKAIGEAMRAGLEPSRRSHAKFYGDGNAAGLIIDLMLENRQ
jgi:UDP-GlcNAc3NAcA epimerase